MSNHTRGYGLGSNYLTGSVIPASAIRFAPDHTPTPEQRAALDPAHICGPFAVSTGSPLTCVGCNKIQPGSFVGTCLRGG